MAVTLTDMVLIHDVFRREFALLPELVRRVEPGDVTRSGVLAAHLRALTAGVHIHHDSEDELIWPKLRERAPAEVALLDDMGEEHEALAAGVARIDELTARWCDTADREIAEALAAELETVGAAVTSHLDHEEVAAFPVMDKYLTQEEWDGLGEHSWARTAPEQVMIFMCQMQENAREPDWSEFLGRLPPPMIEAFHAEAVPAYARYVQHVRGVPAVTS